MPIKQRHISRRLFIAGFVLALGALLMFWSYRSTASNLASLTVSPTQVRQNQTVTLTGKGFSPGEVVSVWITYPDFRVFGVAELEANHDGNFNYPYLIDFLGATFTPTGKYTYTAYGNSSGREVYADLHVDIGSGPAASPSVTMHAERGSDSDGNYIVIRGSNFGVDETIAIWQRLPDNVIVDLGQIQAGPSGSFELILYTDGQPVGRHAVTGLGLRSGLTGIYEFDLEPVDATHASGPAHLVIRPAGADQRNFAIFEGSGFAPDEIVSIWVTWPDGSTYAIGDVKVADAGSFVATLYLGETEQVGTRTYTAYGNRSKLRAIATFDLSAGGPRDFDDPAREREFEVISPDQDNGRGYPECFDIYPPPQPGVDPCTGGLEPGFIAPGVPEPTDPPPPDPGAPASPAPATQAEPAPAPAPPEPAAAPSEPQPNVPLPQRAPDF